MKPLSEIIQEKNKRANLKMKKMQEQSAELQTDVAAGKISAGDALRQLAAKKKVKGYVFRISETCYGADVSIDKFFELLKDKLKEQEIDISLGIVPCDNLEHLWELAADYE